MTSRQNHSGFRVSLTSNDWFLYNERRKYRNTGLGEGHGNMEAEIKVMLCNPRNTGGHQKLEEAKKDSPLETSEEAWLC